MSGTHHYSESPETTPTLLLVWDAPNIDMGLGAILGSRPTAAHRPRFDAVGRWLVERTMDLADDVGTHIEPEATVFTNIAPGSADIVRPWVEALRNVGFAVFAKPKIGDDSDVDPDMLDHIRRRRDEGILEGVVVASADGQNFQEMLEELSRTRDPTTVIGFRSTPPGVNSTSSSSSTSRTSPASSASRCPASTSSRFPTRARGCSRSDPSRPCSRSADPHMFYRWGSFAYRHRVLTPLVLVVGLLALFIFSGTKLGDRLDQEGWDDPGSDSTAAAVLEEETFGRDNSGRRRPGRRPRRRHRRRPGAGAARQRPLRPTGGGHPEYVDHVTSYFANNQSVMATRTSRRRSWRSLEHGNDVLKNYGPSRTSSDRGRGHGSPARPPVPWIRHGRRHLARRADRPADRRCCCSSCSAAWCRPRCR